MYKVVIVDDEHWIVKGLENAINWTDLGLKVIGCFTEAEDALDFIINKKPDIILIDINMPRISGLQMMKIIREKGINSKIIVISGYDNFEYAQRALKYEAIHYILKPVKSIELENAIKKAISCIEKNTHTNTHYDNSLERLIYLDEDYSIESVLAEKDFIKKYSKYQVLAINREVDLSSQVYEKIENLHYLSFSLGTNLCIIINTEKDISEIFTDLTFEKSIRVGVSFLLYNESEIVKGVKQAELALWNYFINNKKNIFFYQQPKYDYIQKLIIFAEDTYYYNLEDLCKFIKDNKLNLEEVVFLYNQIILIANIINIDKKEFKIISPQDAIFLFETVEDMLQQAIALLESNLEINDTFDKKYVEKNAAYEKIIDYIAHHYFETIYLSDVANIDGYNSNYICEIFKEYAGKTFVEYLTEYRLKKGKLLLLHTNLTITEIAFKIGFNDYCYFSKLFKKYYQLTPNQYRKERKIIEKKNNF